MGLGILFLPQFVESEFEFSHDAQIYSFSMESKKDTTKVLPGVRSSPSTSSTT
jgi:hypothetical protein